MQASSPSRRGLACPCVPAPLAVRSKGGGSCAALSRVLCGGTHSSALARARARRPVLQRVGVGPPPPHALASCPPGGGVPTSPGTHTRAQEGASPGPDPRSAQTHSPGLPSPPAPRLGAGQPGPSHLHQRPPCLSLCPGCEPPARGAPGPAGSQAFRSTFCLPGDRLQHDATFPLTNFFFF